MDGWFTWDGLRYLAVFTYLFSWSPGGKPLSPFSTDSPPIGGMFPEILFLGIMLAWHLPCPLLNPLPCPQADKHLSARMELGADPGTLAWQPKLSQVNK